MKTVCVLSWALAASALVIPDEETAQSLRLQLEDQEGVHTLWDDVPSFQSVWQEAEKGIEKVVDSVSESVDNFVESAEDITVHYAENFESGLETAGAWFKTESNEDLFERPPHHRPPHHGPPGKKRPHHPHHPHGPSNLTVFELIAKSNYTKILAKLISEYDDLVELLNGTTANFTVFAPTDKAFEKIPKHAPKPSKKQLKALLTYHVSPEFYPAGRILVTRTIPTAYKTKFIDDNAQRLSTQISFRGLTVNYYARVIAPNIFGTNGVIHGIDSILVPPPLVIDIISAFPGEFSTLELAILKTGLAPALNDTDTHTGGTLFAPGNFAFKRLGPRINAFLFSKYGTKYLKALLLYHMVPNITLYSDAIYNTADSTNNRIPKGVYHIDLPTGLEGKNLSVDVARWGRLITIKINGFTRVANPDGIAADGVIHVLPNVLIPPKKPGAVAEVLDENMSIEELVDRLQPFVEEDDENEELPSFKWDL